MIKVRIRVAPSGVSRYKAMYQNFRTITAIVNAASAANLAIFPQALGCYECRTQDKL